MKAGALKSGILTAAVALFVTNCAKISAPTGGSKDTTPPVVVKSIPPSGTTKFKGKSIDITFNEYFTLDKLNDKFMISPPVKTKPKITVKGKTLSILFMEDLKDSTTYTLNFPEVIKDLNEGNTIPNFQYVFATGNVLDSLSVTGNVVLADNLEAGKNILVMLYGNLADSAPKKVLPDYMTIADANGYFRINNIKAGNYRLFALSDKNSNNRYDLEDETFAFRDSVINVSAVRNYKPPEPVVKDTVISKKVAIVKKEIPFLFGDYKLYLFTGKKTVHYLSSSDRKLPYQFLYYLSIPPDTMKFAFRFADQGEYRYFTEKNRTGDTIMIWLRDSTLYYQPAIKTIATYPFTDSTKRNIYRNDTISMRFSFPKPGKVKPGWKTFKVSENVGGGIKPGQKVIFSSTTPLRPPDTSKIKLYHLQVKEKQRMPVIFVPDSTSSRKYILNTELSEGEKYLFIRDKESFGNIYGDQSDSSGVTISVRQPNSYGHLKMDVRNGQGNMIIQLLSQKESILEERRMVNSGLADFPMLEKGFYRVRVIYDINGDGKWTTGDFNKKIQPEPVTYFPRELETKADWEIVEEWDVSVTHSKPQELREKKEVGN
jgi:uncharacterized protein (DUF2141 family)